MLENILQAFDLKRRPFGAMPDAKCFFSTDALNTTLDELLQSLQTGQGICIFTGDAGSGKTLMCEQLQRSLTSQHSVVFLRHSTFASNRAMLQELASALRIQSTSNDETDLRLAIRQWVCNLDLQRALVVMIDEAENYPTEAIEELRQLTDIAVDGESRVRLLLCGQWRLEERLTEREFDALNQRIAAHHSLQLLSISESIDYLKFRLSWAGGDPDSTFTEQGFQWVARAAGGVPRCLNMLADHCLHVAVRNNQRPIDTALVAKSLIDVKKLPLQWNDLHELDSFSTNESLHDESLDDATDIDAFDDLDQVDATTDSTSRQEFELRQSTSESSAMATVFEFGADSDSGAVVETSASSWDHDEVSADEPPVATSIEIGDSGLNAECHDDADAVDEDSGGFCLTISRSRASSVLDASDKTPPSRASVESQGLTDFGTSPKFMAISTCAKAVKPLAQGQGRSFVVDASSDEVHAADTCLKPQETSTRAACTTSILSEDASVPQFIEEIVLDHYAALQEPEFSGLIWNLARQTQVDVNAKPSSTIDMNHDDVSLRASVAEVSSEVSDDDEPTQGGYVEDIRRVHPNQYLDAIIPLIDDVIDPEGERMLPQSHSRSRDEIEADLLDVLASGDADQEAAIGSEVLELCLDAQAAIRQAQEAVAKSLREQLSVIDCDDEKESFEPVTKARFDVVHPEETRLYEPPQERSVPTNSEARVEERSEVPHEPTRRPFSRLFSELRRRQRIVG